MKPALARRPGLPTGVRAYFHYSGSVEHPSPCPVPSRITVRRLLLQAACALGTLALAQSSPVRAQTFEVGLGADITVYAEPPPPPRDVIPESQYGYDSFDTYTGYNYAGHVWVQGHWAWDGSGWVWLEGYWIEARPGFVWADGYWRSNHYGEYHWVPGRWERERSGYQWRPGHWLRDSGRWSWVPGSWLADRSGYDWEPGRWLHRHGHDEWVQGRWRPTPQRRTVRHRHRNHYHSRAEHSQLYRGQIESNRARGHVRVQPQWHGREAYKQHRSAPRHTQRTRVVHSTSSHHEHRDRRGESRTRGQHLESRQQTPRYNNRPAVQPRRYDERREDRHPRLERREDRHQRLDHRRSTRHEPTGRAERAREAQSRHRRAQQHGHGHDRGHDAYDR